MLIVVSYDCFYFCVVCCNFSIFSSNFIDLRLLLCFLDESGQQFANFIYFLKKIDFSLIDLCYCLLHSFSFISAIIFIIYFLLLTLGYFILSVQFSHLVVYGSLQLRGLQHIKLSCSSGSHGACSNSCPSSW